MPLARYRCYLISMWFITNLNKMDKAEAMELVSTLRQSIQSSAELNEGYAQEFADIPLVGRTIFEQQQLLYNALLEWLNHFEGQFLTRMSTGKAICQGEITPELYIFLF